MKQAPPITRLVKAAILLLATAQISTVQALPPSYESNLTLQRSPDENGPKPDESGSSGSTTDPESSGINNNRPITHKLQIQAIHTQQDASQGGNTATGFGNSAQQAQILSLLDEVWAQVGIDVEILPSANYTSNFAYNGSQSGQSYDPNAVRNSADFNTIFQDPNVPFNDNPQVLNFIFVDHMPDRTRTSEFSASGRSNQDANGTMMFVGKELLDFQNGINALSDLISRQIGFNLGLVSSTEDYNLMQSSGAANPGRKLNQQQYDTIFTDNPAQPDGFDLLQPTTIPEPSTSLLLSASILTLLARRKR